MSKQLGHKDIEIKKLKEYIRQLEKSKGIEPSDEYVKKFERNSWEKSVEKDIFPVISEVLDLVRQRKWTWTKNWDCKYVDIRIDMRDGGAILFSRADRISPDQLRYQYKGDNTEAPSKLSIKESFGVFLTDYKASNRGK